MPDIESDFAKRGLVYAAKNLFDSAELEACILQISHTSAPAPFSMLHYRPLSRIDIVTTVMRDLPARQHPRVTIRPSGGAGEGLFAEEPIAPGTFVGEYTGRIIIVRHEDVQAVSDANDYLFALGMLGPFMLDGTASQAFIDARPAGNHTRFANHSFTPNCASGSVLLPDGWHIFLASNRAIAAGEQLTYDYGKAYWAARTPPLALS